MKRTLSSEDLEKLESFPIYGVQKLTKLGGSYAIILPKSWVEFHAHEVISYKKGAPEETYWVEVSVGEGGVVRIRTLNIDDCLEILEHIREKVKEE